MWEDGEEEVGDEGWEKMHLGRNSSKAGDRLKAPRGIHREGVMSIVGVEACGALQTMIGVRRD